MIGEDAVRRDVVELVLSEEILARDDVAPLLLAPRDIGVEIQRAVRVVGGQFDPQA